MKELNNLCIYVNSQYPTCLMNMILVNYNEDIAKVFCSWFKNVICTDNADIEINNLFWIKENIKEIQSEIIFFVFINQGTQRVIFDWSDKVFKYGFIGGNSIYPEFIKPKKKFGKNWLYQKI